MRKFIISFLVVASLMSAGSALAHGPSESAEAEDSTGAKTNNTVCGPQSESNRDLGGALVYVASNGVEVCNDGASPAPLQGRVIAAQGHDGNPYVVADGDKDNPANTRGYARADATGLHCSTGPQSQSEGVVTDQDGTHPSHEAHPATLDASAPDTTCAP